MPDDIETIVRRMKEATQGATMSEWWGGHLSREDHPCNCAYVLSSNHMGAIATVHFDDGENDCPSLEEAKANQRHIAASNPDNVLALIEAYEARGKELEKAEIAMAQAYQAVGTLGEPFGLEGNEHYVRLLDMLAYQKTEDGKELLPFPCTVEELAPNAVTMLRAALAEAERERDEARDDAHRRGCGIESYIKQNHLLAALLEKARDGLKMAAAGVPRYFDTKSEFFNGDPATYEARKEAAIQALSEHGDTTTVIMNEGDWCMISAIAIIANRTLAEIEAALPKQEVAHEQA